jgi:hypothetical protein
LAAHFAAASRSAPSPFVSLPDAAIVAVPGTASLRTGAHKPRALPAPNHDGFTSLSRNLGFRQGTVSTVPSSRHLNPALAAAGMLLPLRHTPFTPSTARAAPFCGLSPCRVRPILHERKNQNPHPSPKPNRKQHGTPDASCEQSQNPAWYHALAWQIYFMNLYSKRTVLLVSSCGVILLAAMLFALAINRPPKETQLLQSFHAHRADYQRLQVMLLSDQRLLRVANWGVDTTDSGIVRPPQGGFPLDRYDEYLSLLKSTGGAWAFRDRGDQPGAVGVGIWASGFGGDTKHIEICWLRSEPFSQTKEPPARYEHIEGNWYIRKDF